MSQNTCSVRQGRPDFIHGVTGSFRRLFATAVREWINLNNTYFYEFFKYDDSIYLALGCETISRLRLKYSRKIHKGDRFEEALKVFIDRYIL
jgi:hypothetical protein